MVRMLIEILRCNSIAGDCRFSRERYVTLEDLMGAAADLYIGAVAVECLIVLPNLPPLLDGPACVKATARPLI